MWLYVSLIANIIVATACAWAVMSPRIKDGWFGKLSLMLLCFAAFACAAWAWLYPLSVDRSEALCSAAVACMAARCYWITQHKASVRRWCRRDR